MKTARTAIMLLLASMLLVSAAGSLFAGGSKEAAVEAEYKIGIVFDIGGKGDKSFNDSAYRGLIQLAKDYSGYIKDDPDKIDFGRKVELKYMEPKSGGQDREQLLRVLAEDGYDLVFGVGFMFSDSLAKVAKDFPGTHFGLIDGYIPDLTDASNVTCLSFAEHEGSFLVGYVAGKMAAGGKVGFVGGMDMPLIHKFHGGFFAGAMYAEPKLRNESMLLGQYIGKDGSAFNDPKTAENIASNMYRQGATIIYHAAGASGTGLFKAAADTGKLAIGVDSDQGLVYATSENPQEKKIAEYIVTSMLKRVDNAVYLTSRDMIEKGKVTGGYRAFGLANGGVDIAVNDYNRAKLSSLLSGIEEVKAKIISGGIKVPADDSQLREWAVATFR